MLQPLEHDNLYSFENILKTWSGHKDLCIFHGPESSDITVMVIWIAQHSYWNSLITLVWSRNDLRLCKTLSSVSPQPYQVL